MTLRIMSYGNSTSVWPNGNWSQLFTDDLLAKGADVTLFHGAGKGSTSCQEVLRVLRDAPQIKPHLIVALSGICDIGYLLNGPTQPFAHKYTKRMMDFLVTCGVVRDIVYGYPSNDSPAQVWCRNSRMARVLADEMRIPIIIFLQPTQGFGTYIQNEDEKAHYESKSSVVLRAANKSYGQCVSEFYTEVLEIIAASPSAYSHVIDFTNVFADCTNVYRDHRHQNLKGVKHLANQMLPFIIDKLGIAKHNISRMESGLQSN
ncbi:MAG: SGNH/GDSL hydrolase family protein [Balneolales bacterium]